MKKVTEKRKEGSYFPFFIILHNILSYNWNSFHFPSADCIEKRQANNVLFTLQLNVPKNTYCQ